MKSKSNLIEINLGDEEKQYLYYDDSILLKRLSLYPYCLAYFHVVWKQEGCYYCSEFVGELLTKSRVDGTEQLRSSIIQPMQFLRVPHTLLYCGKLREYVSNTCSEGICEDATNHTVHRRLP